MTTVTRIETDVAVVGGGPAGLAAATAAAERDRRVVLLDAYPRLGGQYHMQPLPGVGSLQIEKQATAGRQAIDRAAAAGAMLRRGAEVFWAERRDGGFRLHAADEGGGLVVDARCVVVATGAMERALPFPGWTLPGVLGAGAAQRLIKTGGIAPGRRVVLSGTGPFLHAVAATFAKAGFPLAMILEAGRPGAALLAALSRHPERWAEALGLLAATRSGGATRVEGWAVVEALGERQVEAVRIAPIGSDGRADMARAEVVDGVDALAVGYGFRPVVDITALLKAGHRYDEAAGGWASAADPVTGATEVDGLYACGRRWAWAARCRLACRVVWRGLRQPRPHAATSRPRTPATRGSSPAPGHSRRRWPAPTPFRRRSPRNWPRAPRSAAARTSMRPPSMPPSRTAPARSPP